MASRKAGDPLRNIHERIKRSLEKGPRREAASKKRKPARDASKSYRIGDVVKVVRSGDHRLRLGSMGKVIHSDPHGLVVRSGSINTPIDRAAVRKVPGISLRDDNKKNRGKVDRKRVNIHERYEVSYWADKFGVSREKLVDAALRTKNRLVTEVAIELGKPAKRDLPGRSKRKATRSPAQRAATKRMLAARAQSLKPARRDTSRGPVKRFAAKHVRSAAQKAATKRMLAAAKALRTHKTPKRDLPKRKGTRRDFRKAPHRGGKGQSYTKLMRGLGFKKSRK